MDKDSHRRWPRAPIWVILAAIAFGGVADSRCPPLDTSVRERLQRYVQKKHELPVAPELVEVPMAGSGCYRLLRFASEEARPAFRIELYLSPDQRFLSPELFDSAADPAEEERRKEEALLAGLADGDYPERGPRSAPITLTLFSDLQCPYCADTVRMLTTEILPEEEGIVRLVFRHFPLRNHSWARRAAEATVCAQRQGNGYFWELHDFIFKKQQEITMDNLEHLLLEATSSFAGFDLDAFRECRAEEAVKARVDKDVEFGKWNGVTGTPTLFVNTRRLRAGAPPEQIKTLIRELSHQ